MRRPTPGQETSRRNTEMKLLRLYFITISKRSLRTRMLKKQDRMRRKISRLSTVLGDKLGRAPNSSKSPIFASARLIWMKFQLTRAFMC